MLKLPFILIFMLQSTLLAADFRVDEWQQTRFIWNFGLISLCEKGVPKTPIRYFESEPEFDPLLYQNIEVGDLVWVRCKDIVRFSEEILPFAENPFIILISDGDESFPTDCPPDFDAEAFIQNEKILHIFAQNYDFDTPREKVNPIPIGLDFHTIGYKSPRGGWGEVGTPAMQEAFLINLLGTLQPTHRRKKRIFVDFHHSDTMHGNHKRYLRFGEDRKEIFQKLLLTGLVDHSGVLKRSELWKTKGEYAFSVSPHGNGLDCHRTWEDLVLGCIVIVKTSPLDTLYEGLPVVIVDDWSEINEVNLDKWLDKYHDAFTNPDYREKLTTLYWFKKMQEKL